ncbi:hypothetical protein [Crossiella cryophila]|uniref:Uncharacterized protein n=1 Tax=Crossiella cryophila TaxID=43355 RepID=A0A7W7CF92_9PSEU|nr:hypothetical protein [Crossiella cryophila]MBB4680155.1 hypothetical protein [Crossiella cryophila]
MAVVPDFQRARRPEQRELGRGCPDYAAHRVARPALCAGRGDAGLGAADTLTLTEYAIVALVGRWPFSNPTPAVADPRLVRSRVDFAAMYGEIPHTMLSGLPARA